MKKRPSRSPSPQEQLTSAVLFREELTAAVLSDRARRAAESNAKPSEGKEKPAVINSDAYRKGWRRIFGKGHPNTNEESE